MTDAAHYFGNDLSVGPTGDLALVSGIDETTQRIIRRLETVAGNYIWNLSYGAGLPMLVGRTVDQTAITNLIRSQIFAEPSVAPVPAPTVSVAVNGNQVNVGITYTSLLSGQPETLSFTV